MPGSKVKKGGPVGAVVVTALMLAEGDPAAGTGFANLGVGVADQTRNPEQTVSGGGGPCSFKAAAWVDPIVMLEHSGPTEQGSWRCKRNQHMCIDRKLRDTSGTGISKKVRGKPVVFPGRSEALNAWPKFRLRSFAPPAPD